MINQTVNEGDTALITCIATGKLIPIISWYFNGAPVKKANTTKYMISEMLLNTFTKNSILTVMNLTLSDMGIYTCNATNQVSSDSSSGVLTVNRKFNLIEQSLDCNTIHIECYRNFHYYYSYNN